ncbi:MAG: tetratricopeptide repeat protein [Alphaproteobacteria bacterium]|nr:tetratricopeptide repeat protein [Alphaproteobacteria bacterium]
MQYDRRGIAVTTESRAAVHHLDAAVRSVLGHRTDAGEHLGHALAADPGLAVGHCLAGFAQMLLGRGELVETARRSAGMARKSFAERGATRREDHLHLALVSWIDGDMESCAATLEGLLIAQPLDALVFKLLHQLRFMLGDAAGMRLAAETASPAWAVGVPDRGFILGCRAFALEETDEIDAAERLGREALEAEPGDAWGCHAVAHVFEARCRPAEGVAWLAAHRDRLSGLNNFAQHLAWHAALFRLEQGRNDAALDLYDREIRAERRDDYRDIANAASLLWRLESSGVDIGRRWEELADIAERRIADHALVFAQLHYAMCLVGAGRDRPVIDMLAAMRCEASQGFGTQSSLLARVGLPMAKALFAFSTGEAQRAAEIAVPLRQDLAGIGGSRAQRDVFERMLIDIMIAARRLDEARAMVKERLSARPGESWARDRLARLGTKAPPRAPRRHDITLGAA